MNKTQDDEKQMQDTACVCREGGGVILQQAETPWKDVWQKMSQAEQGEEGENGEERAATHGEHMSCIEGKKKNYRVAYTEKKGRRVCWIG